VVNSGFAALRGAIPSLPAVYVVNDGLVGLHSTIPSLAATIPPVVSGDDPVVSRDRTLSVNAGVLTYAGEAWRTAASGGWRRHSVPTPA
jgi:hypothetical protein